MVQGMLVLYRILWTPISRVALVIGIAGCTASSLPSLPTPMQNPHITGLVQEPPQAGTAGYILGAGDVLRVNVYDHPDLSQEVTLDADGSFQYPLIGHVQTAGLTGRQVEDLIAKRLATGYLVSPQVAVTVTQYKSQRVYVMGAVKTPGPYPLQHQATLLEMLSAAGGPTPDAGFEVLLVRATDNQTMASGNRAASSAPAGQPLVRVQLEQLLAGGVPQRVPLQHGDVIYVPASAFIYVTGEIQHPNRYRLERDTTVFKAITLAGGFTKFAAKKTVLVQRVVVGQRQDFRASLDDLLQAEDVVVVPASLF